MPRRLVMVRRGSLILIIMFFVTVAAVVTAIVTRAISPSPVFAPLSISSNFNLTDGDGHPVTIKKGTPLTFTPFVWCNNTDHELQAHVSLSFVNIDRPPLATITSATLVPISVPKGCGQGPGTRSITPVDPLGQGQWKAILTVSVAINGRIQILTRESEPFTVVP